MVYRGMATWLGCASVERRGDLVANKIRLPVTLPHAGRGRLKMARSAAS